MTKIRHVDFYADEYLAGVATLSAVDIGVYWTACAMIYSRGGPIEIADLKGFMRLHWRAFDASMARLIKAGKLTLEGGQVSCKRCASELQKAVTKVLQWSQNGSKGGRPSKQINDLPKPNGSYARAKGNQEPKERILESKTQDLGRSAPAREGAHEAEAPEEPTQPPVVEAPPEPVESPRPPPQSPAPDDVELDPEPPLTPEERADRVRQLDEVIAALNRRGLPDGAVIDPDAYQRSVEERKWSNWLNGLHGFASQRFDSEVRMRAWEAIDCARTAGSRERTPRQVRDILNQISSLRGAEQRVAA